MLDSLQKNRGSHQHFYHIFYLCKWEAFVTHSLYNRAVRTDVGSAISETMTLLNANMSFFLTDAASELHVSNSRLQELETSYATQKSEVIKHKKAS